MEESKKHQITTAKKKAINDSVRAILKPESEECSKDDLVRASESLQELVPDDYHGWRLRADLLPAALKQIETRQIEPDESVQLVGTPLRESALRDAAEQALRNCAHFAEGKVQRIAAIDDANRVRRMTWF